MGPNIGFELFPLGLNIKLSLQIAKWSWDTVQNLSKNSHTNYNINMTILIMRSKVKYYFGLRKTLKISVVKR